MNVPPPLAPRCQQAVIDAISQLGGCANRRAIYRRARDSRLFSADEWATSAPPGCKGNHDSRVEYGLSWALTQLKKKGILDNPKRGEWALRVG